MTITRSLIADNSAGQGYFDYHPIWQTYFPGSPGGAGGGIYSAGSSRLALSDSTVQGNTAGLGQTEADHPNGAGGGLYTGGMASITHSVFASNRAGQCQGPDGGSYGGAIANHGALTVQNVTFVLNSSGNGCGAPGGNGGAIANYATLGVRDALFAGNSSGIGNPFRPSGAGGGLWNHGVANVIDSAFVNNMTGQGSDGHVAVSWRDGGSPGSNGGDGGGVWNEGSLALTRVTISGNQTGDGGLGGSEWSGAGLAGGHGGAGGGLFNQGVVSLVNTTVSGNRAGRGGDGGNSAGDGGNGGSGGGLYNSYSLAMDNCTLAFNSAGAAGVAGQGLVSGVNGVAGAGGGVYGVFAARDTILGRNSAPGQGPDCAGRIAVGSHNLLHRPAGCVIDPGVANNVIGQSPLLLSLVLNEPGTTATHALIGVSPAIDAGNCSGGTVAQDQRGVLRPQGDGCDIGAYEFDGPTGQFLWLPFMLRGGTP
jgi:hypothetical protein